MLNIKNLTAYVGDKKILDNINLNINDGEIHAIMGPNGTGKSTICKVLMGDLEYKIVSGTITYNGNVINDYDSSKRSLDGIFLLNQMPISVEGVTNAEMLRVALKAKTGKQINIFEFNKELETICEKLHLPKSFIHREINVGMSGGERKKNELLHMWVLKPSLLILDELDSGLDVDALKICSESIKEYYEKYKPSILIITHHTEVLEYIKPDFVHVLKNGSIVKTGNYDLAKNIEKYGFNNANELSEN